MAIASHTEVGSKELEQLQSDLIALSKSLNDCYEFVESSIKTLNEDWKDKKFEEFETSFRSRKEQIMELSQKYYDWATRYLQPRIDVVKEAENTRMSL